MTKAPGRLPLAAVLFALLVAPGALAAVGGAGASSSKKPRADAANSGAGAWVGIVSASYTRDFRREDGAREGIEGRLDITALGDGTNAVASRRVENVFPREACSTIYREVGSFNRAVSPPTVSIFPERYRVDYSASGGITPLVDVEIFEQRRTQEACLVETRHGQSRVLNVYIPIEGPATPNMTRVSGSLSRVSTACPGSEPAVCRTAEEASWDLHLAGAVGSSQWRREWRRQGRPRVGARVPGAGCARDVIAGTPDDDLLVGTMRGELMLGLPGDDRIEGRRGNDCLFGGAGDDVLLGGPGRDLLLGERGNDVLNGGPGNDMLIAGPGRNRLLGGKGNDLILARNGRRDAIKCGPGFDIVIADRKDRVAKDCEVVRRR